MSEPDRARNQDRAKAAVGVAAFHFLIGYAFLTGLAFDVATGAGGNIKLFDVREPPPPPPPAPEPPPDAPAPREEGAAAPPNLEARPSPVVAPPPKVPLPLPPPVIAAPVPAAGPDPSAGASDRAGPGTGSGGTGSGTGSGGEGGGPGGGGDGAGGAKAKLVRGRLVNSDYPRSALRARVQGSVSVRYTVGVNGRVSGCAITKSSGNADLDAVTCRLIERRFRYQPARDSEGRPRPETVTKTYDWVIPVQPLG